MKVRYVNSLEFSVVIWLHFFKNQNHRERTVTIYFSISVQFHCNRLGEDLICDKVNLYLFRLLRKLKHNFI